MQLNHSFNCPCPSSSFKLGTKLQANELSYSLWVVVVGSKCFAIIITNLLSFQRFLQLTVISQLDHGGDDVSNHFELNLLSAGIPLSTWRCSFYILINN
jgi:hypothetical protein